MIILILEYKLVSSLNILLLLLLYISTHKLNKFKNTYFIKNKNKLIVYENYYSFI